jgi:hypothetical protein
MPDFNYYFRDVQKMFEDMGSSVKKEQISEHKSSCKSTCRKH